MGHLVRQGGELVEMGGEQAKRLNLSGDVPAPHRQQKYGWLAFYTKRSKHPMQAGWGSALRDGPCKAEPVVSRRSAAHLVNTN